MTAISVMAKQRLPSSLVWNCPCRMDFSTGGVATGGKRNRLTQNNLESEIFIFINKKYL